MYGTSAKKLSPGVSARKLPADKIQVFGFAIALAGSTAAARRLDPGRDREPRGSRSLGNTF